MTSTELPPEFWRWMIFLNPAGWVPAPMTYDREGEQ